MSTKTPKANVTARTVATMKDFTALQASLQKEMAEANIACVKLERSEFPAYGSTRWIATIEVGTEHPKLTPLVLALKYVNTWFPGVYEPKVWEVRGAAIPTYEISWFVSPLFR